MLFAYFTIERAVERALGANVHDPVVRFDLAFHTAEMLADAVRYLVEVDVEVALRGRRLPLDRVLALADNAVWHWPTYQVADLKKLLRKVREQ